MDPRPDLSSDSHLWSKLLALVRGDDDLFGVLHGFRCMGTLIARESGRYVLRPLVGRGGWDSEEEYARAREQWLLLRASRVVAALKSLEREVPP